MENMYQRNHKQAFENAKSQGMKNTGSWMYMYSKDNYDFFKNIKFRNYEKYKQEVKQ